MTDTTAIQERIGELCHQFRLPTMGKQSVVRFTAAGHGTPWRPCWRCEQEARTAGSGASTGSAPRLGCRRARPGRHSSTTGYGAQAATGRTGQRTTCWPGRTGKTHALCAVGHGSGHVLFAPVVQDLLAAMSFSWTATTSCCWMWATAGGEESALHPHRRALRAPVPGHHLQPGLLPVGAHLRQPHGHGGGHRPGGPPLGHPGTTSPATGPQWPSSGGRIRRWDANRRR